MPDIRYVILSDLHFGAENSILTALGDGAEPVADPTRRSPVLSAFADCLAEIVQANEGADPPTLILAGDVSYERDMAAAVTAWLHGLARRGATVLIGDPGRSYLARDLLEPIAHYGVPVTRDLEDCEIKRTAVYRFRA